MQPFLKNWVKKKLGIIPNDLIREQWLEKALGGIPPGSKILDAGAGEMKYKPLCHHLQYVSQDFGEYNGQGDGNGLQPGQWDTSKIDIISDITAIPQPDGSFDAILCTEVLEHLPAPIDALKELSRLLKPGGKLIVTSPFASLTHFSPYHFYSGFNRYFYQKWLTEFSFKIIELSPNGNFFEFLKQELLRAGEVSKKYGVNKRIHWTELSSLWITLRMLNRLSRYDRDSDQLLCFGYHVLAEKL